MSRLLIVLAALALPALGSAAQEPGERAQRAAESPFRMIIEAAKIKSRKAGEKPPARGAAAASAPAVPPAPAVIAKPTLPKPEADADDADEAPPVPLVVVEPPAREQPESTVVTVEAAATAPATPTPEPEAPPPEPAAPPPLRLIEIVEPVTPRALIGQLRGEVRAQVSFTVAPDGLVREPRIDSISHPLMTSSVLAAVRQWRYEAIPAPRAHGVEIVLRQD